MSHEDIFHERPGENVKAGDMEWELAPELRALEAELAALRPRERLDRARLIFLAGQASVGGRIAAWGWPAALTGMTATAATLLVMLLVRPQPQVVERVRIVSVPVEAQAAEASRPSDVGPASRRSDVAEASRLPDVGESSRRSDGRDARPTWSGDGRDARPTQPPEWSRFGSRAEYLQMLDWMLARGVDPWKKPAGVSGDEAPRPHGPSDYREWLKAMLNDHQGAES